MNSSTIVSQNMPTGDELKWVLLKEGCALQEKVGSFNPCCLPQFHTLFHMIDQLHLYISSMTFTNVLESQIKLLICLESIKQAVGLHCVLTMQTIQN